MNDPTLTHAEIEANYPAEWILLVDPILDDDEEVIGGTVVFHSKSRDEVYRKLVELKPSDSALMFTGRLPPGHEIVL
jgi:hypothetical protein